MDIEPTESETPMPRDVWSAPKLIELEKLAQTSKLSYNTEGGFASGAS
jgi:hypothetical protein